MKKDAYRNLVTNIFNMADGDSQESSVTRGEYRFLLMEYTRMGLELAEMKEVAEAYKWELYEAMKKWNEYSYMSESQRKRFAQLKEEFEPEVAEEGSLEE